MPLSVLPPRTRGIIPLWGRTGMSPTPLPPGAWKAYHGNGTDHGSGSRTTLGRRACFRSPGVEAWYQYGVTGPCRTRSRGRTGPVRGDPSGGHFRAYHHTGTGFAYHHGGTYHYTGTHPGAGVGEFSAPR